MTYLTITVSISDIFVVRATEYILFLYLTKTFFVIDYEQHGMFP